MSNTEAERILEGFPLDYLCGGDEKRCQCFYHLGIRRINTALRAARQAQREADADLVRHHVNASGPIREQLATAILSQEQER